MAWDMVRQYRDKLLPRPELDYPQRLRIRPNPGAQSVSDGSHTRRRSILARRRAWPSMDGRFALRCRLCSYPRWRCADQRYIADGRFAGRSLLGPLRYRVAVCNVSFLTPDSSFSDILGVAVF